MNKETYFAEANNNSMYYSVKDTDPELANKKCTYNFHKGHTLTEEVDYDKEKLPYTIYMHRINAYPLKVAKGLGNEDGSYTYISQENNRYPSLTEGEDYMVVQEDHIHELKDKDDPTALPKAVVKVASRLPAEQLLENSIMDNYTIEHFASFSEFQSSIKDSGPDRSSPRKFYVIS